MHSHPKSPETSGEMKRGSSLRRFTHPGQGEPKPVRCYAQRSPAIARNYEEVRCGSVVRKNCLDVTAHAVGSLQEGTSANHLEPEGTGASTCLRQAEPENLGRTRACAPLTHCMHPLTRTVSNQNPMSELEPVLTGTVCGPNLIIPNRGPPAHCFYVESSTCGT